MTTGSRISRVIRIEQVDETGKVYRTFYRHPRTEDELSEALFHIHRGYNMERRPNGTVPTRVTVTRRNY